MFTLFLDDTACIHELVHPLSRAFICLSNPKFCHLSLMDLFVLVLVLHPFAEREVGKMYLAGGEPFDPESFISTAHPLLLTLFFFLPSLRKKNINYVHVCSTNSPFLQTQHHVTIGRTLPNGKRCILPAVAQNKH